jgi:signal transduction histidine kinase
MRFFRKWVILYQAAGMKMNEQKQPRIRYRTSIWLFSFLILVLFGVFSIGVAINVANWGHEWKQTELVNFIVNSHSLEVMLRSSPERQAVFDGVWTPETTQEIRRMLQPFQLKPFDRIFLVYRRRGVQIFPDIEERDELVDFSWQNPFWKRAWEGIRGLTVEYDSWDGTSVIARIVPENFSDAGPGVLIIFERDQEVFHKTDVRIKSFILFSILGLLCAYIVVFYYGGKMLQPYARLEKILSDAVSMKSRAIKSEDDFRDPVQRAIETFAEAIDRLQKQEYRLEYLGDRLEQPMAPMDAYEEELLAKVNTGIVTFDQNRMIQTMTSRVPKLLRLQVSDVRGETCETVFGADSEICRVLDMALIQKKVVRQKNWKWQQCGQKPVWLSISTTLIQSSDNTIVGVGCVIRDITLLKKLRSQIREKEHLAALGELSAGIAHEFRNPLGAIQGNAQFLSEEIAHDDLAGVALEICNEVKGLERIIRNFLQFARPVQPDVSSVDLCRVIHEEISAMEKVCARKTQMELVSEKESVPVEIDENLFRQVIRNCIENACQAMEEQGKLVIKMEIILSDPDTFKSCEHCVIRFIDTGPGVPVELTEEVFKPFFTTREEGTGLGLAIVKKIVLMHNGFVEFEQRHERGAVLRITFPVMHDSDGVDRLQTPE